VRKRDSEQGTKRGGGERERKCYSERKRDSESKGERKDGVRERGTERGTSRGGEGDRQIDR